MLPRIWVPITVVIVALLGSLFGNSAITATEKPLEADVAPLLGPPKFALQTLFEDDRFPNVVVAMDGTVLVTWGRSPVRVRRSEDGGKTWGKEIKLAPGWQTGGLTVDENTGDIFAFVEANHPPAPITIFRSQDHGKTWKQQPTRIGNDRNGNLPSMHMNEHGITLRHGKHRGRLLRPSRWYAGKNERARWPRHYTNAIYSDDHGNTWKASAPFPAFGTGEAAIVELADGRLYYNSRRHWAPEGQNPRRRWTAISDDGGQTWKNLAICEVLPDGPQDTNYGCMGGLVRLPVQGKDILLYSNCDSPRGRNHGTIWASFDGGKTWPMKRLVYAGRFAYSSINAGRPKTPSEGWIYLHFEGGPKGGSTLARLNLSWVLQGEPTGDGQRPEWLARLENSDAPMDTALPPEQRRIVENVLLYQRKSGGWPKNYDRKQKHSKEKRSEILQDRADNDATIDNGATHREIRILAEAFHQTRDPRFQQAALRGIRYLLKAQYDNGGWPQRFPNPRGYARYITFNDNAMIGVMTLLRDIAQGKGLYAFVPEAIRDQCQQAVARGIDCILKCQIRVDGTPTVWCAQHDHITLEPRKARSYELASLSGAESVRIVRFLMDTDPPSLAIIRAIEAAVAWFERAKLEGIRLVRVEDPTQPKGYDRIVQKDPKAPPMWARFYDIDTNQPIFCSRDGIPRDNLAAISYERRNGYSWLGYYARDLFAKDLPDWKRRLGQD